MDSYIRVSVLILALVHSNFGFRFYQDRIPNGARVTHPCESDKIWAGVGHNNFQGGGENNQFGKDFRANGYKWTKQLCEGDSDGDGKTNGYELGDPDCKWTQNLDPTRNVNITHPGVCDPVNSDVCKAKNDSVCSHSAGFKCPMVENGSDVRQMIVGLNNTRVPPKETTYMCQFVEFPDDDTYDIIGIEPIINNTNVMHHIVIFGCTSDAARKHFSTPKECDMGQVDCNSYITGWTLGSTGSCLKKDIGIRIGKKGWKYAIFQSHWNNPELADHYTDNSGLRLHYTPTLRKYAEATLMMGVRNFKIPPRKPSHIETATITEECSILKQPFTLHIHQVYLHMHYLGKSASLELHRNGRKVKDVAVDAIYSYDRPVFHQIEPAIDYHIGDELKFTCEFDSSTRENVTLFGDATADEMCYAFISVTPFTQQMKPLIWERNLYDYCTAFSPQTGGSRGNIGFVSGTRCHVTSYGWGERPKMLRRISGYCNTTSMDCTPDCVKHLKEHKAHPCHDENVPGLSELVAEVAKYDSNKKQAKLAKAMLEKCSEHLVEKPPKKDDRPGYGKPCVASAHTVMINACAILALLFLALVENIF